MQTLQIQLPDTITIDAREIDLLLASRLYEKGILSVGKAAQMAQLSKRTFMELVGQYLTTMLNYPADESKLDCDNA